MNKLSEPVGLSSPDGREAQLLSVNVHGELLGLMWRMTVRQVWRNVSGAPMAVRFAFPLGAEQTLLDLTVGRGETAQYVTQLQRVSRQRCHAMLGILNTGEQISIEWRVGQLLSLQGGSLRVPLPACLAPRAPHPMKFSIEVHDPVARGTVGSPTHELQRVRHANGMTLGLRRHTALDKDLVLTVHGLREIGFAVASPDLREAGLCTVLASASPRWPSDPSAPQRLRVKLLVDRSSTLPPDRLAQLRQALDRWIGQLQPGDQLSSSHFGDRVLHDLPRLQDCTEAYLRRARTLARHIDTDLGPPAPAAALRAAIAIPDEDEETVTQACILLVTSSPIWAIEEPLRELLASAHPLHVLAIGQDAGDSLWRELALASGGACETLGHGQHAPEALARLTERMRGLFPLQAGLEIGGAQTLQMHGSPGLSADGDTLHLWAQVRPLSIQADLTGRPELQATLHWQRQDPHDAPRQTLPPVPVLWDAQGDLCRLQTSQQAQRLPQEEERRALLQTGQLPWIDSSRLAATAASPAAALAPSAPPVQRPRVRPAVQALASPRPLPSAAASAAPSRPTTPSAPAPVRQAPPRHGDLGGWLAAPEAGHNPLTALVRSFNRHAGAYGHFRAALSATLHEVPTRFLDGLVLTLVRQAGSPGRVWALLLHWLHTEQELGLAPEALGLIEQELASTTAAVRKDIHAAFVRAATPSASRLAA